MNQKQNIVELYLSGLNCSEIAIKLNLNRRYVGNVLTELGIKKRRGGARRNINKQTLNYLTIITTNNRYCRCKCVCGNIVKIRKDHILTGHTKSCGCLKVKIKSKSCKYITGTIFSTIKTNAKARNIVFDLTIEYLEELLIKQNHKCALSGLPIIIAQTNIERKSGINTASLDRKNSNNGYVKNNVQWVHKDVNWMKQDFDEEYFKFLCLEIVKNKG